MTYALGIDLGTTFSAAAVLRDGRVRIVQLGTHGAAIPSVVMLRADDSVLTGEAAERRAAVEPNRVAREFKRRLGDSTPLILGGTPQSTEALMARMLRAIVDQVTEREGEPPEQIAVTHPANWGEFKLDLLRQAIRIAGLPPVALLSEPEAAVRHYASQERVPDGAVIAVYDLGGGTFDAAVLRKDRDGFTVLGRPEGIERLGGIDFDAAVVAHVRQHVGEALDHLAPGDPAATRLRIECVRAKEALSHDLDVTIPVMLPDNHSEVRLTRQEFEDAIRPALTDSVEALRRALDSAGVDPVDLHAVLLVGGSSRIPLVAEVVGGELGRPVAVDTHPKHAVAMGAAAAAAEASGMPGAVAGPGPEAGGADPAPSQDEAPPETVKSGSDRRLMVVLAALVVVIGAVAGAWIMLSGDDGGTEVTDTTTTAADDEEGDDATTTTTERATTSTSTTTTTQDPGPEIPAVECNGGLCVEITAVDIVDGGLRIEWTADGFTPDTGATHAHFFWDIYDPASVSSDLPAAEQNPWELTDQQPFVPTEEMALANRPAEATAVCVTAADGGHVVIDPANFHCFPLPDD